ncbi:pheophorbide A oxygenase [Raphidocelis subcapitata]|uniref:Pheophorbide A oxygenase n=1 Tax=Raphidocelis subcapitata TaxID=307507 RepID=A0A2V0NVG1_9CHLO|nr:pheophorbide A oxygenase [Raphidocelis subcapitata]|eukprot:GBF88927.1 pheophorbide A oxygenase [Raphidocelis subcapitata]
MMSQMSTARPQAGLRTLGARPIGLGGTCHVRRRVATTPRRTLGAPADGAAPAPVAATAAAAGPAVDAPPPPPASAPDTAPAPEPAAAAPFDWQRQWYPVAALECLKTDRPQPLQLLGARLVVFADSKSPSGWAVLEDVCPHRLAPLSDGRLTKSGELMCSYHGWTFDSQGACTGIPQVAFDPKAHATACGSGRACVKRFPTQVAHDLLWVYADASPAAWAEAYASPPAAGLADMGVGSTLELKQSWFQRDTPVGLDLLMENFLDPAHVPWSHHGVIGSREQDARMTMALVAGEEGAKEDEDGLSRDSGFKVAVTNAWQTYGIDFRPPCRVRHSIADDMSLILYACPTSPGWSRVFVTFVGRVGNPQRLPNAPGMPPAIRAVANFLSTVTPLFHADIQNNIIDGDHAFVMQAERTFWERGSHTSWRRQYYTPSSSDVGVISWRRWLDRFGFNLPTLPKSAADLPQVDRMVVFDRFNQHTKHCRHCTRALRAVNIALGLAAAAAALAAGAAAAAFALGGVPALARVAGGCGAALLAAALLAAALLRLRPKFLGGTEYVHAER